MSVCHKGDPGYERKRAREREYRRTKYSKVLLEVFPEVKERWARQAEAEDKTIRGFIKDCIDEHIARWEEEHKPESEEEEQA